MSYFFFFFFQSEDGIRDVAVTGVQTCALPIYPTGHPASPATAVRPDLLTTQLRLQARTPGARRGARSEEHTSELQSRLHLVCRLLLEKKKKNFAGGGLNEELGCLQVIVAQSMR